MANTMDTNSIPEDILFDILTMLPVKSLCRFRCVSKHWFSIISDPNFVAAHLSRSKSHQKLLISVTKGWNSIGPSSDEMRFYSIEYPEEHHESSILHATSHGKIIKSMYTGVTAVSSASGIICCNCYEAKGIKIGNPITRKFSLIQYPEGSEKNYASCYLGFDPIDKRQVMLRLENGDHVKSNVFTLGHWHDITLPQQFICATDKPSICINGVIYFIARVNIFDNHNSTTMDRKCLYAFDVRSECFELIQYDFTDDVKLVIEYQGCVGLVCSEYYAPKNEMKLWILNDPKKHRWSSKSFAVPCGDNFWECDPKLFGATHRGELIFATELSKEGLFDLFLCEIDTNTVRRFKVYGLDCPALSLINTRLDFVTESLYSP